MHARKGGVEVYTECKRFRRSVKHIDIAIKVMKELHKHGFFGMVDVTLKKPSRAGKEDGVLVKLIKKTIVSGKCETSSEHVVVKTQILPKVIKNLYEIHLPQPEAVEYLVSSSYMGIFDCILKVKDLKY